MLEYKFSEASIPQKEKTDTLICSISKDVTDDSIQQLNIFIEQFHNMDEFQIPQLEIKFAKISNLIEGIKDKNLLAQVLSYAPLCLDLLNFYTYICQNQNENLNLLRSYFDLICVITRTTTLFSDNPLSLQFIIQIISNLQNFSENKENLLNIINFIIYSSKDKEFLYQFYSSPQHVQLLKIALQLCENRYLATKNAAQLIVKNLYKNLIISYNKAEVAEQVLKEYFITLDNGDFYDVSYCNEEFIIHTSIAIISRFPETYKIIYLNHEKYFYSLFNYLRADSSLAYFAFQLITLIFQNLPREEPPDLDEILKWDLLLYFFKYPNDSKFRMMLVFSAAYLRFGSAFYYKFSVSGFFNELFRLFYANELTFTMQIAAANCLISAIQFSAETQVFELFQNGVLPILLSILENDSDENLTRDILESINRIWTICKNEDTKNPNNISCVDQFTTCFAKECGYQILNDLNTCPEEAQKLLEIIGDPPNNNM